MNKKCPFCLVEIEDEKKCKVCKKDLIFTDLFGEEISIIEYLDDIEEEANKTGACDD